MQVLHVHVTAHGKVSKAAEQLFETILRHSVHWYLQELKVKAFGVFKKLESLHVLCIYPEVISGFCTGTLTQVTFSSTQVWEYNKNLMEMQNFNFLPFCLQKKNLQGRMLTK